MAELPSYPVKTGLVGLGVLSQRSLLPHFAQPDARRQLDLVAVCDLNADRARQVAAQYEVPFWYTSLETMLQEAPCEALLICTPIRAHHHQALAALQAGQHVYVQKTLAASLADAREVLAAAHTHDRVLFCSPGQMLNPARQAARAMVAEGKIGAIYWALSATCAGGHEQEAHRQGDDPLTRIDPRWYYQRGGGPMFDMAVYALHALTGLLGPVVRLSAMSGLRTPLRSWQGETIPVEVDDNTVLLLEFGQSTFGTVSGSLAASGRSLSWGHVSLFGSEGALEIYGTNSAEPNLANVVEHVGHRTYHFDDFGPYLPRAHAEMSDPHVYADILFFLDCVRNGSRPWQQVEQALHVIEIIERGYLAAERGRSLDTETRFPL